MDIYVLILGLVPRSCSAPASIVLPLQSPSRALRGVVLYQPIKSIDGRMSSRERGLIQRCCDGQFQRSGRFLVAATSGRIAGGWGCATLWACRGRLGIDRVRVDRRVLGLQPRLVST
ncbi:hypothetical protein HDV57DRAFT_116306 [Trichoderma longibrachiatum]